MVAQFSQTPNNLQTFDIRNFADTLTPAKEKNKFICPKCGGHNLSIEPETGKYQCFNGCTNREVREAIKPWDQVLEERKQGNYTQTHKPKTKPVPKPKPAPIPDILDIATIPNPTPPEITKGDFTPTELIKLARGNKEDILKLETSQGLIKGVTVTTYQYTPNTKVIRVDIAGRKKLPPKPYYLKSENNWVCGKGGESWTPYRLDEIKKYGSGKWVLIVEGEECTNAALVNLGIVATTFQGGSWTEKELTSGLTQIKNANVACVIKWPDHDDPGYKKAERLADIATKIQLPLIELDPLKLWPQCPEKGDIADFLEAHKNMTGDDLINILKTQISKEKPTELITENSEDYDNEELSFCQLAFDALYADSHWICVNSKLHKWDGSHYKLVSDGHEKKRIRNFCNTYRKEVYNPITKTLKTIYPYAKASKINEALDWAKQSFHLDIDEINPPGLNCLNGILQILWDGDKPSWQLVDHSPNYYYTYPPLVEYNPKADSRDCDRLLDALDAPQREIFLKVIAASLDLPNVRKYKGRLIRALLLRGTGSNGKDALREAISTIFGKQGVTSATLNDFQQYDDGRRFPLSSLIYSRINWASENTNSSKLDRIQSLKAAITGNPLTAEAKGKDGQEFTPNAVFLFNINDVPNLQGSLEAILSRYGVLDFRKTYKTNADPTKGELEADPRFAYDPLFLRLMVCPALLNRLLDSLKDLMVNGIDYSCTREALEDIQSENSHLFQFIQDTGLTYDPNSYLSASDIWTRLEQWYLENGTLTYEETSTPGKLKAIWADQSRFGDRNIKAVNQVLARFKQLFPKAKLATIPHPNGKKLQQVLQGITFSPLSIRSFSTPISENSTPIPPQSPPQQTLTNQDFHPNHPQFSNTEEKNQKNNQNTPDYPNQILQSQNQINNPQNSEVEKSENFGGGWGGTPIKQGFDGVVTGVVTGVENNLIGVENNLVENKDLYQVEDDVMCHPTVDHAERNIVVKAKIVRIEYCGQHLHYCEVEYLDKNGDRQKATIGGGSSEWLLRKVR
jgi:putative DNA primase/helicase